MAGLRLVFNMRGVDSDATSPFFRSLVDVLVVNKFSAARLGQRFRDGGGEGSLTVVDVTCVCGVKIKKGDRLVVRTNGSNVHVRLRPQKRIRIAPPN